MTRRMILAAAALTVLGHGVQASAFSDPYTSFWALGDSLTDNGNVFAIAPTAIPSPPYFEGRVSSGPTYAEYLAADFTAQGKPNANLAFAGAQAVANLDAIPDLQVQAFAPVPIYADGTAGLSTRATQFGMRPLVSLFIGSNDVLRAVAGGADPVAAARNAAATVLDTIDALTLFGARDFLVFGLPDFALIPRLNTAPEFVRDAATAAAMTFDATIASGIGGLPGSTAVIQIDVITALRDIIDDPDPLGLTNVTDSCITFGMDADGSRTITGVCADPASYAFFDDIHPSGTTHLALANATRAVVAPSPVPLPAAGWAFLAGLGALAALARRRAV